MSKIEDKILGKNTKPTAPTSVKNYFTADVIWQVSRQGCGKSLVNGQMVYEMLTADGKQKARKGVKKIIDNNFIFERQV